MLNTFDFYLVNDRTHMLMFTIHGNINEAKAKFMEWRDNFKDEALIVTVYARNKRSNQDAICVYTTANEKG